MSQNKYTTNNKSTLAAVSNADGETPVYLYADPTTHTLIIGATAPTVIYNGKTTVTTAGTRVTLAASQAVKSVAIKALVANTGTIYVGNASVSSANGLQLAAGESVSLDIGSLNTVNLDSSVNGEGVTYIGTN